MRDVEEDDAIVTPNASQGAEPVVVISADPDQAWKALSLVNDWIKHAETKAVATLAASGVAGGVLFNLVKDLARPGFVIGMLATICGLAVVVAGLSAAVALIPRLRLSRRRSVGPTSPLYFDDIAREFAGNSPSYSDLLHALTGNPDELTRHIAHQVHANSEVARRKYRWANRAIVALLSALLSVGAIAALIGALTL